MADIVIDIPYYHNCNDSAICEIECIPLEDKISYVLNLSSMKWTKFNRLDIISNCILSGGQTIDNVNLFLDNQGDTKMYPDDENAGRTSERASVEKKVETYYSTFRNISIDSVDKSSGVIKATVENKRRDFNIVNDILVSSGNNVNQRHGLARGSYGEFINIFLKNFDKIKNVLITLNSHRTKR